MLNHGKPMAAFCRVVGEDVDEFSGQNFEKYVKSKVLIRGVFFTYLDDKRLIYTVFTKPEERWRFFAYKALKKSNENKWSESQEFMESFLLGYKTR